MAAIKSELGDTMNEYVAVFRDADGLAKAHEIVRRLKEEAPNAVIDDHGSVFNQDVIGAIELGLHARRGRDDRGRLDRAQGVAAAPSSAPTSPSATTRSGSSTSTSRVNGADVPEVSYSPVTITRWQPEERTLLRTRESLSTDARVHAEDPPLRPAVRRRPPHWDEHTVDLRRHAVGARRDPRRSRTTTDGSIGIRCSCQQAICGSCGVRMNGKPGLACNTHLEEAAKRGHGTGWNPSPTTARSGRSITVEPMGNMPVIRDLIVDMDAVHWKKIQRVTPWLINKEPVPEREYIVPHENMVDVTQTMACIQCGACVSDCLSMEVDPLFVGPAALAKAYRFVGDPRDAEHYERLKDLSEDEHGIYDCTHCFNCIDACPKGVDPMSQIMRLRRVAGIGSEIKDRNNGYRHEHAFVKNIRAQRPAARGGPARRLLRRQVPSARRARADERPADGADRPCPRAR